MSQNIHGTFVSEKISKIRWRPDQFNNSNTFVTGSWDNDENKIKLWALVTDEEDSDIYPVELKQFISDGDITEIKFINQDYLIVSTTAGSIFLLQIIDRENDVYEIKVKVPWKKIHSFSTGDPSPCTGLSTYEEDIVTIGEDGRLNLLTAKRETLIRTIDDDHGFGLSPSSDLCSINFLAKLQNIESEDGDKPKPWA